jgi:hypothetical protein
MSSTANANSSSVTMTIKYKSKTRLERSQKPRGCKCNLENTVIILPYNQIGHPVHNLFRSVLFCNLSDCTGTGWLGGIDQTVAYVLTYIRRRIEGKQEDYDQPLHVLTNAMVTKKA